MWTIGQHVVRTDTNRRARIVELLPASMVRIQYLSDHVEDVLPSLLLDPFLPRSAEVRASWCF